MRRAEQLAKTRQTIIKTATKLFLEKGYGNTSTRDIAKEIGITQPALYHHFSDKEVLYLDVLTNLGEKVRQDINRVMRLHDIDVEERLWKITQVLLKYHPMNPYSQFQSAKKLLSDSAKRKLNMLFKMDYVQPITSYFRLPEVPLRPDLLPNEAAELFIAELAPLFETFQDFGGHSVSKEERNKIMLDVFVHGIEAAPHSGQDE